MKRQPSFNDNHPELQDNDVFVGNANQEEFEELKFETKRRGDQSYDRDGMEIPRETGIRPVFVSKSEYLLKVISSCC